MSTNVARFTGLAAAYQKYRPGYPAEVLATVCTYVRKSANVPRRLADIGGGTGISTREMTAALANASWDNDGAEPWQAMVVEPNDDMRHQAELALADRPDVTVVKGEAEALPFKDGEIGLLMAAQAAHWFDRPRYYEEARRVLAPGGTLLVLFNNRELYDDPLMAAFEEQVETSVEGYWRNYRSWNLMEELRALDWAGDIQEFIHPWVWRLTPAEFTGLMLSRSKMTPYKEAHGEAAAEQAVLALAQDFRDADGMVEVQYKTQAACVRK